MRRTTVNRDFRSTCSSEHVGDVVCKERAKECVYRGTVGAAANFARRNAAIFRGNHVAEAPPARQRTGGQRIEREMGRAYARINKPFITGRTLPYN